MTMAMIYATTGVGALIGGLAVVVGHFAQRPAHVARTHIFTSTAGLLGIAAINLSGALLFATGPSGANLRVPFYLVALAVSFIIVMLAYLLWVLGRAAFLAFFAFRRPQIPLAPPSASAPR
jgi:hypothetical protein